MNKYNKKSIHNKKEKTEQTRNDNRKFVDWTI